MGETVFRLFVSSPGDVPAERARAEAVVEKLNAEFKDRARFDAEFWEEHAYTADETRSRSRARQFHASPATHAGIFQPVRRSRPGCRRD